MENTALISGVKIPVGDAAIVAVLGYAVVFTGLILLMCVIIIMGKIMVSRRAVSPAKAEPVPVKAAEPAPGSAGDIKLYGTSDRDAAMIMAIVADKTGKPLNELRFKSIREVK